MNTQTDTSFAAQFPELCRTIERAYVEGGLIELGDVLGTVLAYVNIVARDMQVPRLLIERHAAETIAAFDTAGLLDAVFR